MQAPEEPAPAEPAGLGAEEEAPPTEATAASSAAVEPDSTMGPPDLPPPEEEPSEKVPLKTVSSATADGPEDGAAGKPDGAAASGDQERPPGAVSLWLAKPRVMWWIAVLVAIVLLAVVLVATFLSTGKEAEESVWADEPGSLLRLWPQPRGPHRMIRFRHGSLPHEGREWPKLTGQLSQLVSAYDPDRYQRNPNVSECFGRRPERGRVCFFDVRTVAPECTAPLDFGYKEGSPCIFLQFANLRGWEPAPFTHRDAALLLPEDVRALLKPGLLPLHCEGDTIVDRENLGGVAYTPEQGFRTEFFPYTGHQDYMSPLVAVQFRMPIVGIVVGVRCRLFARNLPTNASAEVFFNLLVD